MGPEKEKKKSIKSLASVEDRSKLSPMMKHYVELCEKYPDAIVLYRLGDFYEMFFDEAVEASEILDLTLTGRECGLEERAAMCGVPYHAVDTYVQKLIAADKKVAICEQLTNPAESKGLVERDVIRIITQGTVVEEELLDNKSNNYIVSLYVSDKDNTFSVCWTDISTGELFAIQSTASVQKIYDVLSSVCPSEIIVNSKAYELMKDTPFYNDKKQIKYSTYFDWAYTLTNSVKVVKEHFNVSSLSVLDLDDKQAVTIALGALLEYLNETQKRVLSHIKKLKIVSGDEIMILDSNTRRNLELTRTMRDNKVYGSLLWAIDYTSTSMGARLLKRFVEQPLTNEKAINNRLNIVDELIKNSLFYDIKNKLKEVKDLERLLTKLVYNTITPRDLLSVLSTLMSVPDIMLSVKQAHSKVLDSMISGMKVFPDITLELDKAIVDEPPAMYKDGGFIKRGYNKELDSYIEAKTNGRQWLAELEAKEKESTGIKNLRVSYNKVFGYYIEVSKSQVDKVPLYYTRKQTLTTGERYITEDLKRIEDILNNAEVKAVELEMSIFEELKGMLLKKMPELQAMAQAIAFTDALNSLAICAVENNYVKPTIGKKVKAIDIKGGRHPVIEKVAGRNTFIKNDVYLNNEDSRVIVLTGPNMSGKSTYMRQTALITLLAHIGSFVPADSASICVVDRIFTRIGASDDLINSQSTFMVEMLEVANILRSATENSLLILDEIGRGTSTCDGLSIAWAVLEEIARNINAKTLFATHFHEINELENNLYGVKNYKILVNELNGKVVFLHKIARGGADKSFGIEVASLAGVPEKVTERAKEIANEISINNRNLDFMQIMSDLNERKQKQTSFFETDDRIKNILLDTDINNLSPVQAMVVLADLIKIAKEQ